MPAADSGTHRSNAAAMGRLRIALVVLVLVTGAGLLLLRSDWGAQRPALPEPAPNPEPAVTASAVRRPVPGGIQPGSVLVDPNTETALFLSETLDIAGEPFSDEVLDRLTSFLAGTSDAGTRLRIAAVLHRYRRAEGTEALLKIGASRSEFSEAALTALALSKTPQALGSITREIAEGMLSSAFLEALGSWPDPAIAAALRTRFDSGAPPGPLLARTLVLQGDRTMIHPAMPPASDWPVQQLEAAALAARATGHPDPAWSQRLSEGVKPGSGLDSGTLIQGSRIAGPEAARTGVTDYIRNYSGSLERWNQEYAAYVRDLRQGTREWAPVQFDVLPWDTAMSGAELLGEWGPDPRASDAVQRLLEVYLQGRRTPASMEKLMLALIRLDPDGAASRLDALGVDPGQVEVVRQLATLNPLPHSLQPRQSSKQVPITIPGEE